MSNIKEPPQAFASLIGLRPMNYVDSYVYEISIGSKSANVLANSAIEAKLEAENIVLAVNNLVAYGPVTKTPSPPSPPRVTPENASKYPAYFRPIGTLTHVDVYRVHKLFDVEDPSGALQHASKKILLSGTRTGGKNKYKDVKEARDTLSRWLEMEAEDANA